MNLFQTVILEMNRLGMMVDLSHVSQDTMRDTLNVSMAPVIFSHSSPFTLCEHVRNVKDDNLLRLVSTCNRADNPLIPIGNLGLD